MKNSVTQKFVLFLLVNRDVLDSTAYRQCQQILFNEQTVNKKGRVGLAKKDFSLVKSELTFKLKQIDFDLVYNLLLAGINKSASQYQNI